MNTFGKIFRLTSFGESHGVAVGGVIDGMPAGVVVDELFIQNELDRRRPGQSQLVTQRDEKDRVVILSGVFDGFTTGAPIGFAVYNSDMRSADYDNLRDIFRPSHADYTYHKKYGLRDHCGGGRSSARETVARCVAGAFAKLALGKLGVTITAYTSQVGNIELDRDYCKYDFGNIEKNQVRCPDMDVAKRMEELITEVKDAGDTIGGVVTCVINGVPIGLGEPVFGKLHADLGSAMLGINAVKGFEYGMGFDGVSRRGSEMNDRFIMRDGCVHTVTNNSGGIQGGISNGEDIYFRVAFKPVATILQQMETLDVHGNEVAVKLRGRHDPCVLPRAVPVVESMAAIVILDSYLLSKTTRI
ncbi:MAG: chorismate synthase [Bacteroidales bacterium]